MVPIYPLTTDISPLPRAEICVLGREGRSLQPVQGGRLVTAGLELGAAASLRVLHVGLGAVLFLLLLTPPSLLPPPLPSLPNRV